MNIRLFALVGVALAAMIGAANAQITSPTGVTPLTQSDTVQLGRPSPAEQFASAGLVGGMAQYFNAGVQVTAFSLTVPNGVDFWMITPAGTLATGTVTTPSAPSDGQILCLMSTQTQTALTVTANTGQTIAGTAISALVAGVPSCLRYIGTLATWYRAGS